MGLRIAFLILLLKLLKAPPIFAAQNSYEPVEKPPIILAQGEQRILRIAGLLKYSVGNKVVRVTPLSRHFSKSIIERQESLLIKGMQPGTGDLWVWKQDGTTEYRTIRVEKITLTEVSPFLIKAVSRLEEAEVIFSGKGVILRGEIYSMKEVAKISSLSRFSSSEVSDETLLAEPLLKYSQAMLEKWLITTKYTSSLRIERVGRSLWLRGSLALPSEQQPLVKQARAVFPLIQTEIETLPDYAPTVFFKVFLLELKRKRFRSLGLLWSPQTTAGFQVTPGIIQSPIQIDLALQHLEGNGEAKILSNPELVVRAPGEAELFAGGELPIQVQSRRYSNVVWKNYGLTLRLKVTHTAGDRVRLEIYTEVSHLDSPQSADKIPGIQANRMKTQVDAQFGVPLYLSGLLQQSIREEARGLPLLRSLPVLGTLFGSQDYLKERSELVAILYPHSKPPFIDVKNESFRQPKGPIPAPRNWISPSEQKQLLESEDYPWNALN